MTTPTCRHCAAPLTRTLVDLGLSPIANHHLPIDQPDAADPRYPLHARVCDACYLVQIEDVVPADAHFNADYLYFSSFSEGWLAHCKAYVEMMIPRLGLGPDSLVFEIASNDGYLLQYFVQADVPVLGIEPTANTAAAAEAKGVPTRVEFWTEALAETLVSEGKRPDLICSANVLAHVPDINDFVAGIARMLTGDAVWTVEFPHLLNMINEVQFDTIYHEHYTYLSLVSVEKILAAQGLRVFDVDEIPTHGGSLRVFACQQNATHTETPAVAALRAKEAANGLACAAGYEGYDAKVRAVRDGVQAFLASARADGATIAAYGAAAKGNTLLNYCGVGANDIVYCVDRNPAKQNTLLPGSHIPVHDVDKLRAERPDYVLILPWNLKTEIMRQLADIAEQGTKFVTAVPEISVSG